MMLSSQPVRQTSAQDLGLVLRDSAQRDEPASQPAISDLEMLAGDHPILQQTRQLLADGFAGVIFSGPPGTSKSFFARRVALSLTSGDTDRVRYVQFHPSYQYEDFIESYEPNDSGGFRPKARTFLALCELAAEKPSELFVLVIDELSRCDAVRVFGEALTYLEKSQRNVEFELASGRRVQIPDNLFIIATMNPWDRGVDELDMAFERRFAKISMEADANILETILKDNGLPDNYARRVVAFFRNLQKNPNTFARIGHAYFARVHNIGELRRLWDFQLKFHFDKAFRQSPRELERISADWDKIFRDGGPTSTEMSEQVASLATAPGVEAAQESPAESGQTA